MDEGRRRHYGAFYGLEAVPDDRPLLVVHGNCQAESIRVLLAGADPAAGSLLPVRIPPAHELTGSDVGHLQALLARTGVLLSQPVRSGYRDLPIGTEDCREMLPPGARLLRFPIVRYLGIHPFQAIVRPAHDRSATPPLVPYHDLRTIAALSAGLPDAAVVECGLRSDADADALHTVGEESIAELDRRERACDVTISDRLDGLRAVVGPGIMNTLNHPGNAVLIALAHRLQDALGLTERATDPGRELLGEIRAPVEPSVLAALGLADGAQDHWLVRGQAVDRADVVRAQIEWYRQYPQVVDGGITRHAERIELLGL